MSDNVTANPGVGGAEFAGDDIGGVIYARSKVVWGVDGVAVDVSASDPLPTVQTGALPAGTNNIGDVDVLTLPALPAGSNNIGDVDVLTVPSDPFGANADAASATGSISAKLRFIAGTGIPITGTVTVGSHAVTNAGTFVVQENGGALTALQLIDDVVYTDDTSTHSSGNSKGALLMAAANPTDASVDTNDIGAVAMTTARELKVSPTTALPAGTNNIGDVDVLTLPAKKMTYAASSSVTVTNLHSIATSSTWVAGWESGAIDNSSFLYIDYAVNAKIVVAAAGLSAGEIRMYGVAEYDDSTWPDVFDGTESTETITDTEMRDAICVLLASTATDTTASDTYPLMCQSVASRFGGSIPRKFVIFITHSTGANLASSGNAVYVRGAYLT